LLSLGRGNLEDVSGSFPRSLRSCLLLLLLLLLLLSSQRYLQKLLSN
jgi:hypothetical protein